MQEGIVTENIAILTEEEKFNEAILSSVDRIQVCVCTCVSCQSPTLSAPRCVSLHLCARLHLAGQDLESNQAA
jgi:hypothetical protein